MGKNGNYMEDGGNLTTNLGSSSTANNAVSHS